MTGPRYERYDYILDGRAVQHYYFYGWPDFGVPNPTLDDAVRTLAQAVVKSLRAEEINPIHNPNPKPNPNPNANFDCAFLPTGEGDGALSLGAG